MNRIVGIGQIATPPPVTQASEVAPLPMLIETPRKLVMRQRTSSFPIPTSQPGGAYCWPLGGMCFTSQHTKDEAEHMCRSGIKPEKVAGRGCPAGTSRIDTYGSSRETSASQFDPCLIKDFPVCHGDERFRSTTREWSGIFGVGDVSVGGVRFPLWTAAVLGIGAGFLIGKFVLRW